MKTVLLGTSPVKKAIRISFDKRPHFLGINTFGIRMRHEFFDKVLTNKETVDYVIDHLAAANFDQFFTSYEKKFRNNLLTNSLVQNNIT
jgi:hypothetical protein